MTSEFCWAVSLENLKVLPNGVKVYWMEIVNFYQTGQPHGNFDQTNRIFTDQDDDPVVFWKE